MRKSATVEAEQVKTLVADVGAGWFALPDWFVDARKGGKVMFWDDTIKVFVSEAWMTANENDWIVSANGYVWAVEEDAFPKLYEPTASQI